MNKINYDAKREDEQLANLIGGSIGLIVAFLAYALFPW
jgi:hypothetical protein